MRITLAVAVACLTLGGLAAADDATAAIRKSTDIPAQGLAPALTKLAKEFDFQVLYRTEIVSNLKSQPAVGALTSDEALGKVLGGTGLTYKYLDDKTVTIVPTSTADSGQSTSQNSPGASDGANASKEVGKRTSQDFRVAQVDQGKGSSPSSVGEKNSTSQENSNSPSAGLSEIVVTAQKREERLIDVPQAVTVFSAGDLSKLAATQFSDFAGYVPGLSFQTEGPGVTQISMRGVTVGKDTAATVGIYVDDVPYGSSSSFARGGQLALDVGLFDIDRIEVLKGPQSTLYGADSIGGVLKYVTKLPDTENFNGDVQAGVSDTHDGGVSYNVAGVINAPIIADKAAVRISAYESHDGGYIDNIVLNQKDVNRSDIYGGRIDVLVTPTEGLNIRVTGFLQDISSAGLPLADFKLAGTPIYGSLDQARLVPESFNQRFQLVSGTINYDLGLAKLTWISSYQTIWSRSFFDYSRSLLAALPSSGGPYGAVALLDNPTTDKFTQEVRLASGRTHALEWLIGGFYTHETSVLSQAFVPFNLTNEPLSPVGIFTNSSPSRYEEYAAFGDLTWYLSDKIDVTGGVRYGHDSQTFEQVETGIFGKSTPSADSTDDVFTYLANARYHFSNHATGYLRYATGYQPGGPNFLVNNPTTGLPIGPPTFQPDRLYSYEGGFKAETSDGRFTLDMAGYHIDWSNIIVTISENGFGARGNAPGGATINGAELTMTGRPIRAFTLTGAFAYQDAYLNQANAALGAAAGQRLPTVPRFTAALNADYDLPVSYLRPTIGASVRYVGDRTGDFGSPAYRLPEYTTADLRAGFTLGQVHAQIYVHNLFDERGQLEARLLGSTSTSPTAIFPISILQPRTIGITATTHF